MLGQIREALTGNRELRGVMVTVSPQGKRIRLAVTARTKIDSRGRIRGVTG